MMRFILISILLFVVYQAVKTVVRAASAAYHRGDEVPSRLPGAEMLQDPNCRTYIVKDRALARRVDGMTSYFCSRACAEEYERKRRS